jgi:hypothetical protein
MRPRSGKHLSIRQRKLWAKLLDARRLEGVGGAALRIDARHHGLDDAVLAGGIHARSKDQTFLPDRSRQT